MSDDTIILTDQDDRRKENVGSPEGLDRRVYITADVVLFAQNDNGLNVLLVKRKDDDDAFPGEWALPGGMFSPTDKTLQAAAFRECREETGIDLTRQKALKAAFVGVFDEEERDPRGRYISHAFFVFLPDVVAPRLSTESKDIKWTPLSKIRGLAFDHFNILMHACIKAGVGVGG